jgi:hypothetical protein
MIWCFGDSNTEGYGLGYPWVQQYTEFKGYIPKWWTYHLSEISNTPITNRGKGGADNYTIFDSIIKELSNILPNDILIVNWSSIIRSRAILDNHFVSLHIQGKPDIPNLSNESIQEVLVNRNSPLFVDEVMGWTKLLKHTFKDNKLIFWSPFPEFWGSDLIDGVYITDNCSPYSIKGETKGKVDDGHPSEKGCIGLANMFYNIIYPPTSRLI